LPRKNLNYWWRLMPRYVTEDGTVVNWKVNVGTVPTVKTKSYKRSGNMLEQLRKFNKDNSNLEDMMALSAFGKSIQSEYVSRNIPAPEWLTGVLSTLGHEITSKTRDQLEKRKRELQAQAAGLESAETKRARIARELAEIDSQLGGAPTPVGA